MKKLTRMKLINWHRFNNCTIEFGDSTLLSGENGAGKSTLIKLLTAALVPSNGSIIVDGQPLLKQERLLKSHLGYLPQTFGLYEELTVYQFLDYIAALKGLSNQKPF